MIERSARLGEPVLVIKSRADYQEFAARASAPGTLAAVAYGSDWSAAACDALADFGRAARSEPSALCAAVNVDACRAIARQHGVESVPSFEVLLGGRRVGFVEGANVAAVRMYMRRCKTATPHNTTPEQSTPDQGLRGGVVTRTDGNVLTWNGYVGREYVDFPEVPQQQQQQQAAVSSAAAFHHQPPQQQTISKNQEN